MNVGYSVSKLKAMIEANNADNKAYVLDKRFDTERTNIADTIRQVKYAKAVSCQGKIHLLGGDSYSTRHEIYDTVTNTWTDGPALPYYLVNGSAIAYQNEIHILGTSDTSNSTKQKAHYKLVGDTWIQLNNLPIANTTGTVCVLDNELYLISASSFYKWDTDTDTWTFIIAVPVVTSYAESFVLNGEIHLVYSSTHYKWNKSENKWTNTSSTKSNTPVSNDYWSVCVFGGVPYAIVGQGSDKNIPIMYYDVIGNIWRTIAGTEQTGRTYGPILIECKGYMYEFVSRNLKTAYRFITGNRIEGNVEKGTFIYAPDKLSVGTGELEEVENGYIAKENTDVLILVK